MSNNTPTLDRGETSYKYALLSIADRLSRGGFVVAPMTQARRIEDGGASCRAATDSASARVAAPMTTSLGAVQAAQNGDPRRARRRGGETRTHRISSAIGDDSRSRPRSTPPASAGKTADLRPVKTFL
jgi:hypothetical protein